MRENYQSMKASGYQATAELETSSYNKTLIRRRLCLSVWTCPHPQIISLCALFTFSCSLHFKILELLTMVKMYNFCEQTSLLYLVITVITYQVKNESSCNNVQVGLVVITVNASLILSCVIFHSPCRWGCLRCKSLNACIPVPSLWELLAWWWCVSVAPKQSAKSEWWSVAMDPERRHNVNTHQTLGAPSARQTSKTQTHTHRWLH